MLDWLTQPAVDRRFPPHRQFGGHSLHRLGDGIDSGAFGAGRSDRFFYGRNAKSHSIARPYLSEQ